MQHTERESEREREKDTNVSDIRLHAGFLLQLDFK